MQDKRRNREPRQDHRLQKRSAPSVRWSEDVGAAPTEVAHRNVSLHCGWGRLIFAHTFESNELLAECLRDERSGERDIGLYIRDPHVVLAQAPQELFLDPSHTFRLWMSSYRPPADRHRGFTVRVAHNLEDAEAINRLYQKRGMVTVDPDFIFGKRADRQRVYLVAEDRQDGRIVGTCMGVDHYQAFRDAENGSSLWCLAVDPDTRLPRIGQALVMTLAERFLARGRAYMDLSVMHDNEQAIALYEKLGFQRVPVFCLKRKNPINQKLFIGPEHQHALNPYARIIVDEALRRGIAVDVLDEEEGYFRLTQGGRRIVCRESLTELTSAIAISRCDNKRVTHRLLAKAGLSVPEQRRANGSDEDLAFLHRHQRVVVKPARGEQGAGISVDVSDEDEFSAACAEARKVCEDVLIESFAQGQELRIVVINREVVAAALRKPPEVIGTGDLSIRQLISKLSRRREAATDGESRIPVDVEAERCVQHSGYALDDVLPQGETLRVRNTANLHTGGTLEDVTDQLSDKLKSVAVRAADALEIPVVGLDLIVSSFSDDSPDYVILEANERVGLANHEPQPTAQRFIDFLFPETAHQVQDAFA